MKKVLGLDISTNSVGWAVLEGLALIDYGEITFQGSDSLIRLGDIPEKVKQLKFDNLDKIIFESAAYVNNREVVIQLSMSFGAALATIMANHRDAAIQKVAAVTWQSYIGNPVWDKAKKNALAEKHPNVSTNKLKDLMREARKEITRQWVASQFGIMVASDNITDAIAVGQYGLDH